MLSHLSGHCHNSDSGHCDGQKKRKQYRPQLIRALDDSHRSGNKHHAHGIHKKVAGAFYTLKLHRAGEKSAQQQKQAGTDLNILPPV